MNGSMHSKVLESIVSPKWFIEQKFICSVLPHNFFFPLCPSTNGVYKGWKEGRRNMPLAWQPCLGRKEWWVRNVASESGRRGARATIATREEDMVMGKLLLNTDNLISSLVVLPLSALLFDCLLPRAREKKKKVQVPVFREQFVRQVRIWGFECQGSFCPPFGLCNQKERMGKACLDREESDPGYWTRLIYLGELNQKSQMPDLQLLF